MRPEVSKQGKEHDDHQQGAFGQVCRVDQPGAVQHRLDDKSGRQRPCDLLQAN